MRRFRNLILLIAPVLLVGCFMLPNATSAIADTKALNNLTVIEAQGVSFESDASLSLPERLALISSSNADSLNLKNGKLLDAQSASDKALSELRRLFENSPYAPDADTAVVDECSAGVVIDSSDPSAFMVVWSVSVSDGSGRSADVVLDDETGLILRLFYRKSASELYINRAETEPKSFMQVDVLYPEAQRIAELLTAYYGLPTSLEDYMRSTELAYYRADLESGDRVIPLYGVVRETSFTINERVPAPD